MKQKPGKADESLGYQSSNDDGDSDRELQLAHQRGLLQSDGLTVAIQAKRPPINNEVGLLGKLSQLVDTVPKDWLERLDVTVDSSAIDLDDASAAASSSQPQRANQQLSLEDDDFRREISFYKQAQLAAATSIKKLNNLGVLTRRPDDYYAEMAKSDQHMKKVRQKLLTIQQVKGRQDAAKRLREERKFAVGVQKEVLAGRRQEKRKLMEAVKKSKKGMQQQLTDMLEKHGRAMEDDDDGVGDRREARPTYGGRQGGGGARGGRGHKADGGMRKTRQFRDQKFGFGGRKRDLKRNTADSAMMTEGDGRRKSRDGGAGVSRQGKRKMAGAGGRSKRPGKSGRKKLGAKKRAS